MIKNGINILRDTATRAAFSNSGGSNLANTSKSRKNCQDNEIYIVDGDRTLLLTSTSIARDINTIQATEANLLGQIRRQDRVMQFLKQRLKFSESQMDESVRILEAQEVAYQNLINHLKQKEDRLISVRSQNRMLEDQHEKDKLERDSNRRKIADLETDIKRKDVEVQKLQRLVHGEYSGKLESLRVEENSCETELNRRDAIIDQHEKEATILRHKVAACKHSCRAEPCTILKKQLEEQDQTVFLLKDQIGQQAKAMDALNTIIDKKQEALHNITQQLGSHMEAQSYLQVQLGKKDQLIQTQYNTISLLKRVDDHVDYLQQAKEIALKILQNTVTSMVNNIGYCKHEMAEGLQKELANCRATIKPAEEVVKGLRVALDNTKVLENFHRDGERES